MPDDCILLQLRSESPQPCCTLQMRSYAKHVLVSEDGCLLVGEEIPLSPPPSPTPFIYREIASPYSQDPRLPKLSWAFFLNH